METTLTVRRYVDALGGPGAAAAVMWPDLPRKLGYDRVLKWLRREKVSARALGDLVRAGRSVGIHPTDHDLSALLGAQTTDCRKRYPHASSIVEGDVVRRRVA